jgi:N-dimethylarginine dimethylaminohydrolase
MFSGNHPYVETPRITRRRLLSGTAGLTLLAAMAGCRPVTANPQAGQGAAAGDPAQQPAAGADDTPAEIFVDYEYGDLKEVVVGLPFGIYPDVNAVPWLQEAIKVLPASEAAKIKERSGQDTITLGKYDAMEQENAALIAILEQYGVKVWRPEMLSRARVAGNFGEEYVLAAGAEQQYARDPFLVIGDNVIENTMGSLPRRADILGLCRLFLQRVLGSNARWVSMPVADYALMLGDGNYDKTLFPVLEGGDVIMLGKKILVGNSANRAFGSSELGYRWLKSYLAPQGYDVERVPLAEDILHLDVALSVPRPGLIVVCPEVMVDGVPSYFDGWQRIEVSREETRYLAANGLPINPDVYIMGYNDHFDGQRVQQELEHAGIQVHRIYFAAHNEDGGSIRCSTHPFYRRLAAPA